MNPEPSNTDPLAGGQSQSAQAELRAAINGDQEAFITVTRWLHADVRRLCHRLLNDREDVDDALQETYLRAYKRISAFEPKAGAELRSYLAWVTTIAYRVCLDLLRGRKRAPMDLTNDLRPQHVDETDESASRIDLARAIAELSAEQRAALILVDVSGFSYDAAAAIMGIPRGTVASNLSRGRERLRKVLSPTTECPR